MGLFAYRIGAHGTRGVLRLICVICDLRCLMGSLIGQRSGPHATLFFRSAHNNIATTVIDRTVHETQLLERTPQGDGTHTGAQARHDLLGDGRRSSTDGMVTTVFIVFTSDGRITSSSS